VILFPKWANFSFWSTPSGLRSATDAAIELTEERNSAHVALRANMKELKGVARGALRGKPGLRAKLEL
jgi:hypothetical protein